MQAHQGKHEALQVLREVVEDAQPVRVATFGDLLELPDLGGGEGDVLVVEDLFLR